MRPSRFLSPRSKSRSAGSANSARDTDPSRSRSRTSKRSISRVSPPPRLLMEVRAASSSAGERLSELSVSARSNRSSDAKRISLSVITPFPSRSCRSNAASARAGSFEDAHPPSRTTADAIMAGIEYVYVIYTQRWPKGFPAHLLFIFAWLPVWLPGCACSPSTRSCWGARRHPAGRWCRWGSCA